VRLALASGMRQAWEKCAPASMPRKAHSFGISAAVTVCMNLYLRGDLLTHGGFDQRRRDTGGTALTVQVEEPSFTLAKNARPPNSGDSHFCA
jgi:hypothetical protein